jgi:isoleucyl-tRNA synthetase
LVVHILPREGYVFANQKDIFVALDTRMTDALVKEGYARELINKIQFTRKDLGLEIMDTITLSLVADEDIIAAMQEHSTYILSETLCQSSTIAETADESMQQVDINGHEVHLGIKKACV